MSDAVLRKYHVHKSGAASRGIAFDLTFEQWREIRGDKLEQRGRSSESFGMLRTRDEGGYTVGNVRLGTPKENHQEAAVAFRVKKAQSPASPAGGHYITPPSRGAWLWRGNVFDEYTEDEEEFT